MKTPIFDFAAEYKQQNNMRLHMPGHKGAGPLGAEALDITEIDGADSLYEASGIIAQSEQNASLLFGCPTYYSTEGSSQCIRAMLYLACLHAKKSGKICHILAGRNAHKTFLSAAALLDFDITWLMGGTDNYLSCIIDPAEVNDILKQNNSITALYVTSPDYLGNMADIAALAAVCHAHGVLLLVDNAHGAYLKFLPVSQHPTDLGADICCDSAHKTLPVLTGGAYLHVGGEDTNFLCRHAKKALALFGSTSPSYLILQSLDLANPYLDSILPVKLKNFTKQIELLKTGLISHGFALLGDEPMKITIDVNDFGYQGNDFTLILQQNGIVHEFSDDKYVVLILSVDTDLQKLRDILCSIPKKKSVIDTSPCFAMPQKGMRVRAAVLADSEEICVADSIGRTLASPGVGCPPAVPIVMCGEIISKDTADAMQYYGIKTVWVVKE